MFISDPFYCFNQMSYLTCWRNDVTLNEYTSLCKPTITFFYLPWRIGLLSKTTTIAQTKKHLRCLKQSCQNECRSVVNQQNCSIQFISTSSTLAMCSKSPVLYCNCQHWRMDPDFINCIDKMNPVSINSIDSEMMILDQCFTG